MAKILIEIRNNELHFSIRKRLNNELKNLLNTNIISQNELVFSEEYINSNLKLVNSFIKELVDDFNLDTIVIKEYLIANTVLNVTSSVKELNKLYILEESIINYDICNKILKSKYIEYINIYNIPTYLLELLDKENIKVESKNELLFLSNFMKDNNLDTFSSIYYKNSIYLNLPLNKEDEEDFNTFININKYLKAIYVNKLNKNDIENILEVINKNKLKNIKVYLKQNINNIEIVEYLKKINKQNSKTNGVKFKIDYSKDYLEDNLMSQIHLNIIKTCIITALFLVSSVVVYVFSSNYISMQKVGDIQNEIKNTLAEYKEKKIEDKKIEVAVPEDNNNIEEPKDEEEIKKEINQDVAALKEINDDAVGWLKVNNTNVDYPVVQAEDNDFYLKKNFKKQNDASGWIFMDYRADAENLSQNTIIFGHNMYYSGVMFGTLYKTKYKNWYMNEENQIIEFDNIYGKMKWQIFSIYNIEPTNDYLIADFSTKEKYQDFLQLITNRSIYTFNTPVSSSDKILTLSTCSSNGTKRLVIHAVLLSDN